MSEVLLQAHRREPGRSNARALRRQSVVPGIYYFHGEEPIPIAAGELALRPLIYTTESHLVRLRLEEGLERTCVVKDVVFDPITDRPVHFDLQGVAADEAIRVEVPVVLHGTSIGQRQGGILDHHLHRLAVECMPGDLPEHIEIDITELGVGDSIHVRHIQRDKLTFLDPEDATIVTITHARVEVEVAPQVAAAEPEVIAKGKEEEE